MLSKSFAVMLRALAACVLLAASGPHGLAQTNPKCDPVDPIADVGWSVVPSLETIATADGAPYQGGDRRGLVRRSHHHAAAVLQLLQRDRNLQHALLHAVAAGHQEQVQICKAAPGGASAAIAPYAGPCPPK